MNIKTANRLCELRKQHGLSQEALADKLGVSRQAISKWERSESSPDTDNLIELAKLYNMSLDDLLNGEDVMDIIEENKEANKEESEKIKEEDNKDENVLLSDDEGNAISISNGGISLKDNEGNKIEIKNGKINIVDADDNVKVVNKMSMHTHKKEDKIEGEIAGLYTLVVIIAYLLLGLFVKNGWANYWFLFITIPLPGSIYKAIAVKDAEKFAYPVFISALYCALGMFIGWWHPGWVLFLTIPVYYIVVNVFKKKN